MKKLITTITTLLLVSLFVVSCDNDDDQPTPPMANTIANFVANNSDYSNLKAALDKAGLTATLDATEKFTVFAPNNDAFSAFLSDNGFSSLEDVPTNLLKEILLNHVVSGEVKSSALSTGYIETLAKESSSQNPINMYVNTSSGVQLNGTSKVTGADNMVDNGVIHAVDKVIGLPTVVTFASADSTFSTLVAALTRESSFSYVATLNTANGTSPAPFTVFAPTNDAFAALLTELEVSSLADIPTETLEATLNSHVVGEANVLSTSLSDGMTVNTLGDSFTINLGSGATFTDKNGRTGNIVVTDVQAANGVIHVLDKVILFDLENNAAGTNTIADIVSNNADYSSLKAALDKAELTATLADENGDFTVFAPKNDAFATFLADKGFANLEAVPTAALKQILLNHVVSGTVASNALSTGYISTLAKEISTDNAINMYVNTTDGVKLNGTTTVTTADIDADNGIVHAVNSVIDIPTVVTFATADATFSTLVSALTREDSFNYVSTLSTANGTSPAPFTVFAPTNDAFGALLTELGASGLGDIPTQTLEATLNSHVVGDANVLSTALSDGMKINTLGDFFTIDLTDGAKFIDQNDRKGNIVVTDVQAGNGVIHVIDKVILPKLPVSIAKYVSENADFSSLKAALDKAELTDVLDDLDSSYTVFAPTNDRFATFLNAAGFSNLEAVPTETLKAILLNHVLSGVAKSNNLSTGYVKTLGTEASTNNPIDMYIDISDGVKINGMANVVTPDVIVDNGVIHVVDAVIDLPTIVTFATADATFSTLVAALTREASFTYVNTLKTANGTDPAPFTVFAPTNDAFGDLLTELHATNLADIATATLEATLNTHVVGGANVLSSSLTDGMTINTLGDSFTIDLSDGAKFKDKNNRTGNIVVVDVQAANGVIHVVDKVILPDLH